MTAAGLCLLKNRILAGQKIDRGEVDQLIKKAKDGLAVTDNEKAELKSLLAEHGEKFTSAARATLAKFLKSDICAPALRTPDPVPNGRVDGSMGVDRWGGCDEVALAGVLFKEPVTEVTIDGVTFTPQDVRGLLSVLADSQARGTDLAGARDSERPDSQDLSPMDFHNTLVEWLGEDKRPAAMERDSGSHVWNYNFWKADLKDGVKLEGASRPDKPGHNGPASDGEIMRYSMDVYFGESSSPQHYDYWLEFDAKGEAINGGWMSDKPDVLWRSAGFSNWSGSNSRNPFVDPEVVKEIYMKSIGDDGNG